MTGSGGRLLGLATATAGAAAALAGSGHGALAAPPVGGGLPALRVWAEERDAVTAALASARAAALVVAAYLAVVLLLGVAARFGRGAVPAAGAVVGALDRLTPRIVRTVLDGVFGVGAAAASLGLALGPVAPSSAAERAPIAATAERPPTLRRVADGRPPPTSTEPAPAATPTPPGEISTPYPPLATWTVHRGEHFWAIAEAVVQSRSPTGEPSEREIARYWLRLIAANRHRLPDPDNADLLFPGTRIVLP